MISGFRFNAVGLKRQQIINVMPTKKTANGAQGVFDRHNIENFDKVFAAIPYTFDGLVEMGRAIRFLMDMRKPGWQPGVDLPPEELDIERNDAWSLSKMAEILNREYGTFGTPLEVTRDKLGRHIKRRVDSLNFEQRLIEQIAGLELLKNPKSGEPYDTIDFLSIGKELLNWRTGEYQIP